MNTENQKSQFKLKSMFAGIQLGFGSNIMVSNRNMTDAIGLQLLDNHPHGENLFDKLPEDIDAIRSEVEANSSDDPQSTASRLVELKAMERKDLNSLAVESNIESPERYRNKTAIAEAILAIEDAGVDASVVVNDNNEKQDPVDGGIPDIPSKSNSKE